jgi:hypothetical protein
MVTNARVKDPLVDYIHPATQQVPEVLHKPDVVQQGTVVIHADQQVDVAGGRLFSANDRAENPHMVGAMRSGQLQDLLSPVSDVVQRNHALPPLDAFIIWKAAALGIKSHRIGFTLSPG